MSFPDGWRPVVYWWSGDELGAVHRPKSFNLEAAFALEPREYVDYLVRLNASLAAVRLAGIIFDLVFSGIELERMEVFRSIGYALWGKLNWTGIEPSALELRGQVDRGELTMEEASKGTVIALNVQFGPMRQMLSDPRYVRRPKRRSELAPTGRDRPLVA